MDSGQSFYPSECVHQIVSAQARETPDAVAVGYGGQQTTYRELEKRSNQLANLLRRRGIGVGTLVGLLVERTPEMIVALLGILKAGAAYVPLDPSYPSARLTGMLTSSGAPLLISETHTLARLGLPIETETLLLDTCVYEEDDARDPAVSVTHDDLCYVIFTSGSTGQPKGVQIRHGSFVNLLWSMKTKPGVSAGDVLLGTASVSFDVCGHEVFLPLITGGRFELASFEEISDPARLLAKLEPCGVTILATTPVLWRLLILAGWTGKHPVKVICGGEEMTPELATELMARSPSVWNCYGPTETTVCSTCIRVTSADRPIPLGEPVANTSLHVLDENRKPVPAGDAGELYIGGHGLAIGYLNRPDLTAERFVTISTEDSREIRAYRTGDRVRLLSDGSLEFLGRVDLQVKLRGFRIELGEIEQVARKCPGVQEAAVLKLQDAERGDFLAAFIVPEPGEPLFSGKVRSYLQRALPAYMLPSTIHLVSKFPVTPNGKVDRKQLASLLTEERRTLLAREEPIGALEAAVEQIWCASLNKERIGRHDNFFEIGGDSLLAAQVAARMSRQFDKRCGVATLHQSPTVALYAAFLAGHKAPNCVVLNQGSPALQEGKLFWIDHPDRIYRLAGLMGDQPFSSILLSPEELAMFAPEYRMEQLADRMVKQILQQQQRGKFYIGGFCQNALLAYEVGQQLRRQGYEVPLLIMIDPEGANSAQRRYSAMSRLKRRLDRERFHLSTMLSQPPSGWLPYLQRRQIGIRFVLEAKRWQRRAREKDADLPTAEDLAEALFVAQLSYTPAPYPGRVLFIQPSLRPRLRDAETVHGWQQLVRDYRRVDIFGDHLGLFAVPGVEVLAAEIERELKDHQSGMKLAASSEQGSQAGSLSATAGAL